VRSAFTWSVQQGIKAGSKKNMNYFPNPQRNGRLRQQQYEGIPSSCPGIGPWQELLLRFQHSQPNKRRCQILRPRRKSRADRPGLVRAWVKRTYLEIVARDMGQSPYCPGARARRPRMAALRHSREFKWDRTGHGIFSRRPGAARYSAPDGLPAQGASMHSSMTRGAASKQCSG